MFHKKTLALSVATALAFIALTAATAQAEGPFYRTCKKKEGTTCIEGGRLKKGESLSFGVKATVNFVIEAATKERVTCTSVTAEKASLIGSEPGTGASGEGVAVFKGCTVQNNGAACEVEKGEIKTERITATLVKENEKAVKGEKILVSFRPTKGAVFVKVKFTGTCTLKETPVELKAGAKLGLAGTLDLGKPCTKAEEEEAGRCQSGHPAIKFLENESLEETSLVHFPTTLLNNEWFEEAGKVAEIKEGMAAFGSTIIRFEGHVQGEVAGTDWGIFGQ